MNEKYLKLNDLIINNFDFLVICSGSKYDTEKIKIENLKIPIIKLNQYDKSNYEKFSTSKNITIIGSGGKFKKFKIERFGNRNIIKINLR
jgi:hypothetical protein